jgi:hypothetical protein
MAAQPKRVLSKSKFSMYLRTKCDRELYLSLFSNPISTVGIGGHFNSHSSAARRSVNVSIFTPRF